MSLRLSIDRFEENYAVCQDDNQKLYEFKITELPFGAKPGDIIIVSSDGSVSIDLNQTRRRKEKIKKLQDKLFK